MSFMNYASLNIKRTKKKAVEFLFKKFKQMEQ